MRHATICPRCNKQTHTVKETHAFGRIITFYACGHSIAAKEMVRTDAAAPPDPFAFLNEVPRFSDMREYQKTGVKFGLKSNVSMLIADEPGVGKTPQAMMILAAKYAELTPCLLVVPAHIVFEWAKWFRQWCPKIKDRPYIHFNTKAPLIDEENIHIVSASALAAPTVLESIKTYGFKCMIVDEAQYFKNEDSSRTVALMDIAPRIPHKMFLSGTPIVNRVAEYFPVLHMLRPDQWPNAGFLNNLCERDDKGRPMQLRADRRDYFFNRTADYIIRRRKLDVVEDMPPFQRDPIFFSAENNKNFVAVYNDLLDQIEETIDRAESGMNGQLLGIIAKIRHITGIAKIPLIIDKALEFLEGDETGKRKLAIGTTHLDVRNRITEKLRELGYKVVTMGSEGPMEKSNIQKAFERDAQILCTTIMGCAEGRNMQFCDTCIIGERFWNPAKEEQFEQRFWRFGQKNACIAYYTMLEKTLDHWFHDMVEIKRGVVGSALDVDYAADHESLLAMARRMTATRLKVTGV